MPERAPIRRSADVPTPYRRDALQQRRKTLEKQLIESVLPPDAPGPSDGPDSQHMSKFFKALSDAPAVDVRGAASHDIARPNRMRPVHATRRPAIG